MTRWLTGPPLVALAGIVLALAGLTQATDGIVRYVVGVVDTIAWWDIWRPVFDPPPMNTYTYRPLTVVIVKLELLLSGRDPFWMTVLHLPAIPWLGLAAHRFLRAHGLANVATPAAITAMALPSMLFAGWIPVESDTIGAAFVCELGYALQRWRAAPRRKHLVLLILMALGAATTKETSAAAGFGYLACAALAYRERRLIHATLVYGVTLAILVLPLILAKGQVPHQFHVQGDGFSLARAGWMLLHNAAQVFYVVSSAGAVLILVGALPARLRSAALVAGALFLLAAPPMRLYNHYESVIIDQVDYVAVAAALLLLGLLLTAVRKDAHHRVLVGAALFLPAVLVVAPIVALQSRPDVSARLYAPVVPALSGLAWAAARQLVSRPGWSRAPAWLITVCWIAFPLTGAWNATQLFRARMAVEVVSKQALADLLTDPKATCPFVIAINRNHELAVEELQAMGAPWTACSELFVPNRVHLDPADTDLEHWAIQGHRYSLLPGDQREITDALLAGRLPDRCTYLYVQGPKAMMETHDFQRFAGDFRWAFNNLPEFDEGIYLQQVEIQFREQTGMQKLMRRAGARELSAELPYDLLPINLNEVPRRLWADLPVLETYAYEGRTLFLDNCTTAQHQ